MPPTSWLGAAPGRSLLLMHEVEVLALPKPGIHRPPCERLTSRSLTGSTAIHGVLQLPACVLIIEYLRAPLDHHRPEDVGHCVQVFQGADSD